MLAYKKNLTMETMGSFKNQPVQPAIVNPTLCSMVTSMMNLQEEELRIIAKQLFSKLLITPVVKFLTKED
jgi:hypothetical protein